MEEQLLYKPRPIRFLEFWEWSSWRVKIYGICSDKEKPENKFIEIAKAIGSKKLPLPAVTTERYGLAFLTIHQAEMFNQIILNWWERVNELRHHVFKAEPEKPYTFNDITTTGEAFCVWELRVLGFEREAWIESVLKNPGAGFEKYIKKQLNEDA